MPSKPLALSHLASGGLITNYFCTSTCRHCLYRCSPDWPREYITAETARRNLEAVRRLGCTAVHVGGGEPLLRPDGLAGVLDAARQAGVRVEYVETNSSWYQDHASACAILEKLAGHGLDTLLVSISPLHNEAIPFYKVKGVMAACRQVGLSIFPWIADFATDLAAFDERRPHAPEEYCRRFGEDYWATLPRRYWISPGGRALETFGGFRPQKPLARLIAEGSQGCGELAEVGHFHLDLYGNYVPGLCAGLAIRRDDLGAPLKPEDYPLITRLFAGGIGALVAYAAETHGFPEGGLSLWTALPRSAPSKPAYGSKCEVCYEVRRFLAVDKGVDSRELAPRGHYLYG